MWNSEFQLEIEGSYVLASYINKAIHIKTEQFLFGKPIVVENVDKIDGNFQKGNLLLVYGKRNLHYGIGQAEISSEELLSSKPNTIIIKGIKNKPFDRGWYLREGD